MSGAVQCSSPLAPGGQITCHAWSAGGELLAVCANASEVEVYRVSGRGGLLKFVREATLREHDMQVVSMDFCGATGRLLTASHDRNAWVWHQDATSGEWKPTVVVLQFNRAALCARWAPGGRKFAVGGGGKAVCVAYFQEENDWWAGRLIKRRHASAVLDVAWHPCGTLLATGAADFKVRVFNAKLPGEDAAAAGAAWPGAAGAKFGECLLELDARCWAHGVAWSPSGGALAFVSHDACVRVLATAKQGATDADVETIRLRKSPCAAVAFLGEDELVAAGWDNQPYLLTRKGGAWAMQGALRSSAAPGGGAKAGGSAFASAFEKFHGGGSKPVGEGKTAHANAITSLRLMGGQRFSTAALDGRLVVWDAGVANGVEQLAL